MSTWSCEHVSNGSLLETISQKQFIKEPKLVFGFSSSFLALTIATGEVLSQRLEMRQCAPGRKQQPESSGFGFCEARNEAEEKRGVYTQWHFCGSYAYASPEILSGTPYAPQMADIWSLWCYLVCYGEKEGLLYNIGIIANSAIYRDQLTSLLIAISLTSL